MSKYWSKYEFPDCIVRNDEGRSNQSNSNRSKATVKHTFVDQDLPFYDGVDGTKMLSSNANLFDSKHFYFQLLSFNIPSRGYNRHCKLLREKAVIRPELPGQPKIACMLIAAQKAVEQQENLFRY